MNRGSEEQIAGRQRTRDIRSHTAITGQAQGMREMVRATDRGRRDGTEQERQEPAEQPTYDYLHHYDYYISRYIDECSYICMFRTHHHTRMAHTHACAHTPTHARACAWQAPRIGALPPS